MNTSYNYADFIGMNLESNQQDTLNDRDAKIEADLKDDSTNPVNQRKHKTDNTPKT